MSEAKPIAKIWSRYEELIIKGYVRKPRTNKSANATWLYYTVECQLCWKVFDIRKNDWWHTKRCSTCAKRKVNTDFAFNKNQHYVWKRFWHLTIIWLKEWYKSHGTRCDVICECWHISEKNLNYVVSGKIDYCWRYSTCTAKYPYWLKNWTKTNKDYRDIIGKKIGCLTVRRYTWHRSYLCRCNCWALYTIKRTPLLTNPNRKYCLRCKKDYFRNNRLTSWQDDHTM